MAQWWVVVASLFFYGFWNWRFLPILALSVTLNFHLGRHIAKTRSKPLLVAGLAFNLGLLAYFKYANFLIQSYGGLTGSGVPGFDIVLPLGISFFTFQKAAFLVDCRSDPPRHAPSFRRFAFFVSFFPQLIAGPVVHHAELIPQISKPVAFDPRAFGQGLCWFVVGLFKKAVIADRIAEQVDPLFSVHDALPLVDAWTAALGYGLQIYFDFSGYSEMAVGMGLMFGLSLPVNFNSPYRAASIQEFWGRWHITLSRFLRQYLYIPLGGNRHGFLRGLAAVFVTMALGGLWHGAAWTFVLWGVLHGCYIGVFRVWRLMGIRRLPLFLGRTLTLLVVFWAWVPFRAGTLGQTVALWRGMAGANGVAWPSMFRESLPLGWGISTRVTGIELALYLILLAWCLAKPGLAASVESLEPTRRNALCLGLAMLACVFSLQRYSSFIYWQF